MPTSDPGVEVGLEGELGAATRILKLVEEFREGSEQRHVQHRQQFGRRGQQ